MKKYIRRAAALATALVLTLSLCLPAAFALDDPQPHCTAAIVVDGDNNEVLYDYNAYEKRYPASVTKIMTLWWSSGPLTPESSPWIPK